MDEQSLQQAEESIRQAIADMVVGSAGDAVFCACAIDAGSVYLSTDEAHLDGKAGTGDFAFAEISEVIDYDVYDEHYNMSPDEQKTSDYAKQVAALVAHLEKRKSEVFGALKLHDGFIIYGAEHGY